MTLGDLNLIHQDVTNQFHNASNNGDFDLADQWLDILDDVMAEFKEWGFWNAHM